MLTIVCFGDLWVNEVCVYIRWRLDLKAKIKTWVQLYRFGINGLSWTCSHRIVLDSMRRGSTYWYENRRIISMQPGTIGSCTRQKGSESINCTRVTRRRACCVCVCVCAQAFSVLHLIRQHVSTRLDTRDSQRAFSFILHSTSELGIFGIF